MADSRLETAPTGRVTFMPEPGRLELREYRLPETRELPDGALLVRTLAAGVCGTELHIFSGRHPLKSNVMGHEIVAEVTARRRRTHDSAGALLHDGDRVSAPYFLTCSECPACVRGQTNLCQNAYRNWAKHPDEEPHFTGTHGTHYFIDPKQWIFKVPDNVPTTVAASANCGLSQMWEGIDRAKLRAGERVVIQGAGGLGLYATAIAKERGASVMVIDSVPRRLTAAANFGADITVNFAAPSDGLDQSAQVAEWTNGEGADLVLGVAGVPAAFTAGLAMLRNGGRYIEIGNVTPGATVPVDIGSLTRRQISIIPVLRYRPRALHEALHFLARTVDRLPFDELNDAHYPIDGLQQALEDSAARKINRAVLVADVG